MCLLSIRCFLCFIVLRPNFFWLKMYNRTIIRFGFCEMSYPTYKKPRSLIVYYFPSQTEPSSQARHSGICAHPILKHHIKKFRGFRGGTNETSANKFAGSDTMGGPCFFTTSVIWALMKMVFGGTTQTLAFRSVIETPLYYFLIVVKLVYLLFNGFSTVF